jgi:hypothetical protein
MNGEGKPNPGIVRQLTRWGMWLAALLLIAAASLKLISLYRLGVPAAAQLHWPSIIFPFLSEILLIKVVIVIEYLVAFAVFFSRDDLLRVSLLAWLSSVFLGYHFCLYALGQGASCHCLGTWNTGSQRTFDSLGLILLGVLLGIGWGGLAAHAWPRLCAGLRALKQTMRSRYDS